MDWVHCNNCFLLPSADKSFYLTSCGHIYCCDCEEQCARGQCKLCGNQCSAIVLSSSMKTDVQKFFTDPDELLKKKMKEVQQVSDFQKNHRARLVAHQRKQLKKYESIKQDFRKLLKNLKDVESERKHLSQENNVLKKVIRMQQSPRSADFANAMAQSHSNDSHNTPHSYFNTALSSFINKMDSSKTHRNMPHRVSVISPPQNGKLGVIQGTPSPSSVLRELCLSSANSNESNLRKVQLPYTPGSSPSCSGATQSVFVTPATPLAISPTDSLPSNESLRKKKMVVHPFSPNY